MLLLQDYIYLVYMLSEMLNKIWIKIGVIELTPGNILLSFLIVSMLLLFRKVVKNRFIPIIKNKYDISDEKWNGVKKILNYIFIILGLLLVLIVFSIDYTIIQSDHISVRAIYLLIAILIFQIARFFNWITSNVLIHSYYQNRDRDTPNKSQFSINQEDSASRIGQYFVYILAVLVFIRMLNLDYPIFHNTLDNGRVITFNISNILIFVLIILGARLFIWVVIQLVLYNLYKRNGIDIGAQYSINQLLKYVIYTIAVVVALDSLGIDMTLLLGGAAALLVGIGLGLQSTFNDFISGIVLLFERSVEVGDIIKVGEMVGEVKRIGLRSSIIEIWDSTTVLIPNSKLVNESVVNWTHFNSRVRQTLSIGVAYGSDTQMVKQLLLSITDSNPYIMNEPSPFVRFESFGDSSLVFSLYFFSKSYRVMEDIKSDMRFKIDALFRENNIEIPFPQREVWLRK